jgi:hypothetical protein
MPWPDVEENDMRINTSKISGRIRLRITRPWRGMQVGTIITPVAAMRQVLLQQVDQLGQHIAEVVEEDKPVASEIVKAWIDEMAVEPVKRGRGRPPKVRE